jgi:23S rRNA (uracil1939-C5)-methyltransferase
LSIPPGERRRLVIEAVGAQGDGVASGVFVPLTLPGEEVLAKVAGVRGELVELIAPSTDRVAPPCPHFGECGGCALQHWRSAPYLTWKVDRIRRVLLRAGMEPEIMPAVAVAAHSRRRLALHARRAGAGAAIGFKARRSWRLAPIETCVIAEPALVAALPALRALALPFLEHPKSAPTLHVTASLTGLDIDVTGIERRGGGLSADARMDIAAVAQAAGFARVSLAGETLFLVRAPRIRAGGAVIDLPPGTFTQAVAAAEAAMVAFTLEAAAGAGRIADLYCGVGAFTFPLARLAPVRAADVSAPAIAALSAARGGATGLRQIEVEARDLDRRPLSPAELADIDTVVIDPPRAGAEAQHRQIAASRVARVISASCNPTTFARDGAILRESGFRLARVLPVDQFLWSPHIELIGLFTRDSV